MGSPARTARPDFAHRSGMGLDFEPDGRAQACHICSLRKRPGPMGFLTDGSDLGLIFRPDDQAELGPRFSALGFGRPDPTRWMARYSSCSLLVGPFVHLHSLLHMLSMTF